MKKTEHGYQRRSGFLALLLPALLMAWDGSRAALAADIPGVSVTLAQADESRAELAEAAAMGEADTESDLRPAAVAGLGPKPVRLGAAKSFAILSKTGVTDVYASAISGDVGASPITGAAILLSCDEMAKGTVYTVDAAGPLPCRVIDASMLTSAIGAMQTAYVDAAGRKNPDFTELASGKIGGLTLKPGLYKWSSGVSISKDLTLDGGPNDTWIFQIAGTLTEASSVRVKLSGGAKAKHVYWQTGGKVSIGTGAHFEGILLAKTTVAVKTGASVRGRLLTQTAVTLQQNVVKQPAR